MAKKYLDYDGLLYFWQKLKTVFLTDVSYNSTSKKIQKTKNGSTSDVVTLATVATSGSYNDLSNKPTIPTGVEKTTTTPLMDGTAAIGSEVKFAAGDHVHPTDTSRAPLASPAFTGTPTAPTATVATDTTQIATTAFVHDVVDALDTGVSDVTVGGTSVVTNGVAAVPGDVTVGTHGLVPAPTVSNATDFLIGSGNWASVDFKGKNSSDSWYTIVQQISGSATSLAFALKNATTSLAGLMSSSDKTKLDGIATGAEVNQNAFSNVKVGSTTVAADSKTDTLELAGGYGVLLTPDATNDKIYIEGNHSFNIQGDNNGYTQVGYGAYLTIEGGSHIITNRYVNQDDEPYINIAVSGVGSANGICPLNASTKIDSAYLPSYVDDVVEAYARSGQTPLSQNWLSLTSGGAALTPETGKIYILMADTTDYAANTQFRWSGTTYVKLNDGGVSSITNAEIDTIMAS